MNFIHHDDQSMTGLIDARVSYFKIQTILGSCNARLKITDLKAITDETEQYKYTFK